MIRGMPSGMPRAARVDTHPGGWYPLHMRVRTLLLACFATSTAAHAQPVDPYAPDPPVPARPPAPQPPASPTPAQPPAPKPPPRLTPAVQSPAPKPPAPGEPSHLEPASDEAVLAEQVAAALVQRAQELYDARVFLDAKQLAVEALVRSPKGMAADQARFLIKSINQQLGIVDEPEVQPELPDDKVDLTPITDPIDKERIDAPETPPDSVRAGRVTTGVHSALYVGLLGATVGAFIDDDSPAKGAVPVGVGAGLLAGWMLPRAIDKLDWHDGQIRTVGAGSVWGGVIGAFFADAVNTEGTEATHVLAGASIGSTIGVAGGVALARKNRFSHGDVALVDTFAGIGAIGGLTMGMLMQPAESEAYSVNAVLGTTGGVIVGVVAANKTNTTPRRMVRVAGLAAAGGALPFLLYAGIHDKSTNADERVTGLLSTAGLLGGAYLGFRLTRDLDVGLDVVPGQRPATDDAPVSLIGRHSDGRWAMNGLTIQPLSQRLAPQSGMTVPLLGGAW